MGVMLSPVSKVLQDHERLSEGITWERRLDTDMGVRFALNRCPKQAAEWKLFL